MWNPKSTAYLIAAYSAGFPQGSVFFCVVDPDVGSGARTPVVVQCDGNYFVGPDNGQFEIIRRRAAQTRTSRITWQPKELSASFHGRDLYAPISARCATAGFDGLELVEATRFEDWPDDLAEIVYVDHYGNAMSGLRAELVARDAHVNCAAHQFASAATFAKVPRGTAFWYCNSNGLLELAVNQGHAAQMPGLSIGAPVHVIR
jgi:S-adenosylmethionine hydrolase